MAASAVKRLLSSSSPLSFSRSQFSDGKPQSTSHPPYFGVPLLDIIRREGTTVPNLVSKLALFLLERGLDQVGIFRVSGNAKVIDRLRTSFDRNGDALLTDTTDVMSVAGLLKLFFRELPETLIPERFTQQFVSAQENSIKDPDGYVGQMRHLLNCLPDCNYVTLKYLIAFLVLVAREESENKMNANALATIFGPNMFRCVSGLLGLKEQGITNGITLHFITKYNDLFLKKGERSPYDDGFKLSDLMLSKPSRTVHHEGRPASSKLMFRPADEPDQPTPVNEEASDNDQSSSTLPHCDINSPAKRPLPSRTPMMSVIDEAINQAILEYVFGETIKSFMESDEPPDDIENSWSLSDDDNKALVNIPQKLTANSLRPAPPTAKTEESDSASESDTSSNDSDKDLPKPEPSKPGSKSTVTVGDKRLGQDKDTTEAETKSRRPVSSTISPSKRGVEPVSSVQLRATSAPSSRPNSMGTKENFGQAESTTAGRQYMSQETTNSSNNNIVKHGHQSAPKSPLAEKQAWSVLADSEPYEGKIVSNKQSVAEDRLDQQHQKELRVTDKEESYSAEYKRLTRHIHACKKKIQEFEEEFEATHGYKPMQSDKASNKDVRRCLEELPEARRRLNALETKQKEKQELGQGVTQTRKEASRGRMEDTLAALAEKLKEKRQAASRPENLSEMTREEICEEKLCIQKALLHFETLHGRPSTPREKELMHPLYDRYRKIKRLLARQRISGEDVDDIQNMPGNLSFISACTQSTAAGGKGTSVRSGKISANPVFQTKAHTPQNLYTIGRADPNHRQQDPAQRRKTESVGKMLDDNENLNLNQLSLPRLMSELQKTKAEKKHLQLALHSFEEDFQREHGRKVQKYDQLPMETEYRQYKTTKAKLKLLEVLLSKHQQTK